jgi:hypothetical protein
MQGKITSITKERSCSIKLPNDILVVLQEPTGQSLALGDMLLFHGLNLDTNVSVTNLSQETEFTIYVAANKVHDLRLPMKHGSSRTPTLERMHEA